MKLKHAQQELKNKQAEVKKMDSGYKKDQEAFEAVRKAKEKLETEMKKLNYEGLSSVYLRSTQQEGFLCIETNKGNKQLLKNLFIDVGEVFTNTVKII